MAFEEYAKGINMRNFAGATVAATSCCGFNSHASDKPVPVQCCHYDRSMLIATAPSLKFNGYLKMKNLILVIMLITIGTVLPIDAFAKMDAATLENQRAANKARLEKTKALRAGKSQKELFKKSNNKANRETKDLRSMKSDALPPTPRRRAKVTYNNSERALPANPARVSSTAKP